MLRVYSQRENVGTSYIEAVLWENLTKLHLLIAFKQKAGAHVDMHSCKNKTARWNERIRLVNRSKKLATIQLLGCRPSLWIWDAWKRLGLTFLLCETVMKIEMEIVIHTSNRNIVFGTSIQFLTIPHLVPVFRNRPIQVPKATLIIILSYTG